MTQRYNATIKKEYKQMTYNDYTLTKEHSNYRLYLKWHLVLNITDGSQRSYWYRTKKEALNIIEHNFIGV